MKTGAIYHHIHELDWCSIFNGVSPETVTRTGGNVAHQGENFGDEDDMILSIWNSSSDLPCLNGVLPIVGENTMS